MSALLGTGPAASANRTGAFREQPQTSCCNGGGGNKKVHNGVYTLINRKLKEAYVGSGNLRVRLGIWKRKRPHLGRRVIIRSDKKDARLGAEQIAIEWFREFVKKDPGWTLLNRINAISPKNPGYKDAIKAGKEVIKKSLEDPGSDEFDQPAGENFDLPGAFYSDLGGCAVSQWHGLMCTF